MLLILNSLWQVRMTQTRAGLKVSTQPLMDELLKSWRRFCQCQRLKHVAARC